MKAAAIYARVSTDKQSESSCSEQVAACRAYAHREGLRVVLELEDAGISGSTRHNRPGLLELIDRIDEWDVLLAWDVSRLARDGEDLGWLRNVLKSKGRSGLDVKTNQPIDGLASKVLGVFAEEYLENLARDTHRGMLGLVAQGKSAGGRPYGYRSVPADGGGVRWEPDPDQARWVAQAFAWYSEGSGLREILGKLDDAAAPSPRGGGWKLSGLQPMLRNPVYRGERIWNRSRWVKDHATGKRRRVDRPESEWVRGIDESIRIVDEELWDRVQAIHTRNLGSRPAKGGRPPRYVLSGLLECGECAAAFHVVGGRQQYGCRAYRDHGKRACSNSALVPRLQLEERVLRGISDLLSPDQVAEAVGIAMERAMAELNGHGDQHLRDRLKGVENRLERAVDLATRTGSMDVAERKVRELTEERASLSSRLARTDRHKIDPGAVRDFILAKAADVRKTLAEGGDRTRRLLRDLVGSDRMRVYTRDRRSFVVRGTLGLDAKRAPGDDPRTPSIVVAGAGFEPTTCGL